MHFVSHGRTFHSGNFNDSHLDQKHNYSGIAAAGVSRRNSHIQYCKKSYIKKKGWHDEDNDTVSRLSAGVINYRSADDSCDNDGDVETSDYSLIRRVKTQLHQRSKGNCTPICSRGDHGRNSMTDREKSNHTTIHVNHRPHDNEKQRSKLYADIGETSVERQKRVPSEAVSDRTIEHNSDISTHSVSRPKNVAVDIHNVAIMSKSCSRQYRVNQLRDDRTSGHSVRQRGPPHPADNTYRASTQNSSFNLDFLDQLLKQFIPKQLIGTPTAGEGIETGSIVKLDTFKNTISHIRRGLEKVQKELNHLDKENQRLRKQSSTVRGENSANCPENKDLQRRNEQLKNALAALINRFRKSKLKQKQMTAAYISLRFKCSIMKRNNSLLVGKIQTLVEETTNQETSSKITMMDDDRLCDGDKKHNSCAVEKCNQLPQKQMNSEAMTGEDVKGLPEKRHKMRDFDHRLNTHSGEVAILCNVTVQTDTNIHHDPEASEISARLEQIESENAILKQSEDTLRNQSRDMSLTLTNLEGRIAQLETEKSSLLNNIRIERITSQEKLQKVRSSLTDTIIALREKISRLRSEKAVQLRSRQSLIKDHSISTEPAIGQHCLSSENVACCLCNPCVDPPQKYSSALDDIKELSTSLSSIRRRSTAIISTLKRKLQESSKDKLQVKKATAPASCKNCEIIRRVSVANDHQHFVSQKNSINRSLLVEKTRINFTGLLSRNFMLQTQLIESLKQKSKRIVFLESSLHSLARSNAFLHRQIRSEENKMSLTSSQIYNIDWSERLNTNKSSMKNLFIQSAFDSLNNFRQTSHHEPGFISSESVDARCNRDMMFRWEVDRFNSNIKTMTVLERITGLRNFTHLLSSRIGGVIDQMSRDLHLCSIQQPWLI